MTSNPGRSDEASLSEVEVPRKLQALADDILFSMGDITHEQRLFVLKDYAQDAYSENQIKRALVEAEKTF